MGRSERTAGRKQDYTLLNNGNLQELGSMELLVEAGGEQGRRRPGSSSGKASGKKSTPGASGGISKRRKSAMTEEEERRQRRLFANRRSAQKSRSKRLEEVGGLEGVVDNLSAEVSDLKTEVDRMRMRHAALVAQHAELSSHGGGSGGSGSGSGASGSGGARTSDGTAAAYAAASATPTAAGGVDGPRLRQQLPHQHSSGDGRSPQGGGAGQGNSTLHQRASSRLGDGGSGATASPMHSLQPQVLLPAQPHQQQQQQHYPLRHHCSEPSGATSMELQPPTPGQPPQQQQAGAGQQRPRGQQYLAVLPPKLEASHSASAPALGPLLHPPRSASYGSGPLPQLYPPVPSAGDPSLAVLPPPFHAHPAHAAHAVHAYGHPLAPRRMLQAGGLPMGAHFHHHHHHHLPAAGVDMSAQPAASYPGHSHSHAHHFHASPGGADPAAAVYRRRSLEDFAAGGLPLHAGMSYDAAAAAPAVALLQGGGEPGWAAGASGRPDVLYRHAPRKAGLAAAAWPIPALEEDLDHLQRQHHHHHHHQEDGAAEDASGHNHPLHYTPNSQGNPADWHSSGRVASPSPLGPGHYQPIPRPNQEQQQQQHVQNQQQQQQADDAQAASPGGAGAGNSNSNANTDIGNRQTMSAGSGDADSSKLSSGSDSSGRSLTYATAVVAGSGEIHQQQQQQAAGGGSGGGGDGSGTPRGPMAVMGIGGRGSGGGTAGEERRQGGRMHACMHALFVPVHNLMCVAVWLWHVV